MRTLTSLTWSLSVALPLATVVACSDDVSVSPSETPVGGQGGTGNDSAGGQGNQGLGASGGGGNGGTGNEGGAPLECQRLPGDTVLAVDQMYYGDTDFAGTPSPDAWEGYGFDIDGQVTTNDLTAHCIPFGGVPASGFADAPGGIDNSFGRNLLPILLGFRADFSAQANALIDDGELTYLLRFGGLAAGPDQPSLETFFYGTTPLGSTPAFDGSDCWPVAPETLIDPVDLDSAVAAYTTSSVAGNVWTSNGAENIVLRIVSGGVGMDLPVNEARMVLNLAADHQSGSEGVLGGVIPVDAFIEAIQILAGSVDPTLCSGSTFDSIADQIREAADIMVDGTQDPTATCNGISIGVGFTASATGVAGIGDPSPPLDNPCR